MAKLVSKTYGEALFELAVEEGKEEEFLQEIESLKEILDANPDFGKLMNHPKILKEEKLKVVEEVFKGHISRNYSDSCISLWRRTDIRKSMPFSIILLMK